MKAEGAHFFPERNLIIKSELGDADGCNGIACMRDKRETHQEGNQGWAPIPYPKVAL